MADEARWEPVIGLEIHVQLATRTKMFCGCELSFGDEPNIHTCPICLGHPGTLPVTNEQAVNYGIQIALALGCEVAPRSIFHRKNYFYPDLPKGYQISQFDIPLGSTGALGDVRIHRVHLEEDAAKLLHTSDSGRIQGAGASRVDFNRGGTPLVEIVTEPDLRDASAAKEWLQLLRTTVRRLGVSDVNMDEGSLRCDANVSIRPAGATELGTKTELKNMNSFRFIERGVEAEIARQIAIAESGGRIEQETLHFDPKSGALSPLRSKEYSHDYRYFPEPDLVPLVVSAERTAAVAAGLPELPEARLERYRTGLGLAGAIARQLAYESELGDYLEAVLAADPALAAEPAANWVTGELVPRLRVSGEDAEEDPAGSLVSPAALAELVTMVQARQITTGAGREVLDLLVAEGGDARALVEREGLASMDGGDELAAIVDAAIAANPAEAQKVRDGVGAAVGPIVGYVMRETKGRADGGEVNRLIRERLG